MGHKESNHTKYARIKVQLASLHLLHRQTLQAHSEPAVLANAISAQHLSILAELYYSTKNLTKLSDQLNYKFVRKIDKPVKHN